jgi:hypothetical protein
MVERDINLLQSLYSGAYYQADLPYGRSARFFLSRGQKLGDKSSPLLFGLIFNALLLAIRATGVGYRTVSGLQTPHLRVSRACGRVWSRNSRPHRLLPVKRKKRHRRCLAPCLAVEKEHILSASKGVVGKVRHHKYLLGQMVPAVCMVAATSRLATGGHLVFRPTGPLNQGRDR